MTEKDTLLAAIEEQQQELFTLLSELIQVDSQNFGTFGREKELACKLAEAFQKLGLETHVYSPMDVPGITEHRDYYAGRGLEDRRNMTVLIPGSDHQKKLMLAAHLDTVPVGNLENWSFDPFGGEIRDGKILGRGACDDKYAIAAVLFLVKLFKEKQIILPYDLIFTAYCDEEKGGGNGALAASLLYPCDDLLNLDCKNLDIWAAGAGGGQLRASIRYEKPGDSCERLMDGVQIYREEMQRFRKTRHDELEQCDLFQNSLIPDTALRFLMVNSGGDLSLNRAAITVSFYTSAEKEQILKELAEIEKRLQERLRPSGMVFEGFSMVTRFFRYARTTQENPALDLMRNCILRNTGEEREGIGSCLSDLPLFIRYGSRNAFSFGAGRDFHAEGGAHQPDEFIECSQLLSFTCIIGDFLLRYPRG